MDFLTLWNDAYRDIPILREGEAKPREGAVTGKSPASPLAVQRFGLEVGMLLS